MSYLVNTMYVVTACDFSHFDREIDKVFSYTYNYLIPISNRNKVRDGRQQAKRV
jgi:glutaredoxin